MKTKKVLPLILKKPITAMALITSLLFVVAIFLFSSRTSSPVYAAGNVTGYAWSSNIGFISMSGPNYGVNVDQNTGVISGYAWSSNIGWISFNPDANMTDDCPLSNCQAQIDFATGKLSGSARACSVFLSACSGRLKDDSIRGGWDGYIALAGPNFGLKLLPDGSFATGPQDRAWGADVVGWVDFNAVKTLEVDNSVTVIADSSIDSQTGPASGKAPLSPTIGYKVSGTPTSCTATGDWKDKTTPQSAGPTMTYQKQNSLAVGTYNYTLTCTYADSSTKSATATVVVSLDDNQNQAPGVSLTANPMTVIKGSSTTLTWSTVNDPDSCTASGPDWSGAKAIGTSKTESVGSGLNVGTYNYSITCSKLGHTPATASVAVTIKLDDGDTDGPGGQCSNITDPNIVVTFPPYRKLQNGSCVCVAGYVMNSASACVKPVYTEH